MVTKILLFLVLLPFLCLAFFFLVLVPILIGISFAMCFLMEHRFLWWMRQNGRYLRLSRARSLILEKGGTFIIEVPTLGWGFTHAWWTPDDLLAISPFPVPTKAEYEQAVEKMQCLDWDDWCWKNYTCPEHGRAFLIRVWNGMSLEPRIITRFPNSQVVRTWTALVHFPNPPETTNEIEE